MSMFSSRRFTKHVAAVLLSMACLPAAQAAPQLDLTGYADASGAITILHKGQSADPYFAMQALLLAHENGFDVTQPATRFVDWLLPKQKPDGTFDRFCRDAAQNWAPCKTADADDALLAIWMKLLDTLPAQKAANPAWAKSYEVSKASLAHLYQPSRGVYMVSPVYLHGLFMDNLEVWSMKAHLKDPAGRAEALKLSAAIHATFWEPVDKRFLVATQLEQRSQKPAFYPDRVAQIFPLLVDFPVLPQDPAIYYRQWMKNHRAEWLAQGKEDYPWGLIAVLAMRQKDTESAGCWLRVATPMRHSARWAVTDEAAWQIVSSRGVKPAAANAACF